MRAVRPALPRARGRARQREAPLRRLLLGRDDPDPAAPRGHRPGAQILEPREHPVPRAGPPAALQSRPAFPGAVWADSRMCSARWDLQAEGRCGNESPSSDSDGGVGAKPGAERLDAPGSKGPRRPRCPQPHQQCSIGPTRPDARPARAVRLHLRNRIGNSARIEARAIASELSLSLVRLPALNVHQGLTSALAAVAIRSISEAPG